MNKKNTICLLLLGALFTANNAFAGIPASAVSSMRMKVYGVYATADVTCATGWVTTSTFNSAGATVDFSANATIGTGAIPASIGCVLIIVGNQINATYAAGTYTTTTGGISDSVCNAGGLFASNICGAGSSPVQTWPAATEAPTKDMATAGLTKTTACTGASTEIIPLYLSVNSKCTGNSNTDSAACVAANGANGTNNFTVPTSTSDLSRGTALTAPAVSAKYKFVVGMDKTIGGKTGPICNMLPPTFGFATN